MTISANDVCAATGLTYRPLDYWIRRGLIRVPDATPGSGNYRQVPASEVLVVRRIALLCRAGMALDEAAHIARTTVEHGVRAVDLPGGLRLVFPAT
jgi:DNA-binding transcriptional MerR regulator